MNLLGPFRPVIQHVYDRTIRDHLPRKIASYSGVPVRNRALFDTTDVVEYKPRAIEAIQSEVSAGDTVVDVASGHGIFAVVAARSGASVESYDADRDRVKKARETARLSFVSDRVEFSHAVVGSIIDDRFASDDNRPYLDSIPECDVLILDVEGAEAEILEGLVPSPRAILVEVHPGQGITVSDIRDVLRTEYEIVTKTQMKSLENQFIVARAD